MRTMIRRTLPQHLNLGEAEGGEEEEDAAVEEVEEGQDFKNLKSQKIP
jgi:hypothetical protein